MRRAAGSVIVGKVDGRLVVNRDRHGFGARSARSRDRQRDRIGSGSRIRGGRIRKNGGTGIPKIPAVRSNSSC